MSLGRVHQNEEGEEKQEDLSPVDFILDGLPLLLRLFRQFSVFHFLASDSIADFSFYRGRRQPCPGMNLGFSELLSEEVPLLGGHLGFFGNSLLLDFSGCRHFLVPLIKYLALFLGLLQLLTDLHEQIMARRLNVFLRGVGDPSSTGLPAVDLVVAVVAEVFFGPVVEVNLLGGVVLEDEA
eukprot:CAMPEP_0170495576 /NCGR_PEP_ID=MMETSP0208-20121228/17284_1 /TAXON_ID=197538 /ORGANISM="Strombidium inclinatum, Strain S3" /LENGTH=180 /DNA_ID=CAMNT_0010771859 /DNA_START=56 /DNA_END=595 /DNA_ORIENTATION=-